MTFSDHFKHSLRLLGVSLLLLVGAFFYLKRRIHDVISPPHVTLPRNDKEIVRFDENRHIITVTTAKGTVRKYSRSPDVEIRKDGTVKVDANAWGTELRPFLGVGYLETGRAFFGANYFYFKQIDASFALGWTADNRQTAIRPILSLGYNLWSNTSLNVGVDPVSLLEIKKQFGVFLSVKL